jgi:PleD family two-component response regulator
MAGHVQYRPHQFRSPPESIEDMAREADRVMYSVKLKGKNSVAVQGMS